MTDVKKLHAMDSASTRDESIAAFINYAKQHPEAEVLLAGDFNEASQSRLD